MADTTRFSRSQTMRLSALTVRKIRHVASDCRASSELDVLYRLLSGSHRGEEILEVIFSALALLPELHSLAFRLLARGAEVSDRVVLVLSRKLALRVLRPTLERIKVILHRGVRQQASALFGQLDRPPCHP